MKGLVEVVALQGGGGVQPGQRRVSRQLVPVVRPSARENLKIKTKMTFDIRFNEGMQTCVFRRHKKGLETIAIVPQTVRLKICHPI